MIWYAWSFDVIELPGLVFHSFSCMSHTVKGRQKTYQRIVLSKFQPSFRV
jgi:hypothetical protein